jgi:hypothetical protein
MDISTVRYLGERETLVEREDVGVVRDDVLRVAAGVAEGARHEDPVPHLQSGHAAPHLLHETRRIWKIRTVVRNKLNITYRYLPYRNVFRVSMNHFFKKFNFLPVFRIHAILVWIRIRIRGSMPLTDGSGFGACYFSASDKGR